MGRAVSCEHSVILAHFELVSLPSNPSSKRFSISRWRWLTGSAAISSRNCPFRIVAARMLAASDKAWSSTVKNQANQTVMSKSLFWVASSVA